MSRKSRPAEPIAPRAGASRGGNHDRVVAGRGVPRKRKAPPATEFERAREWRVRSGLTKRELSALTGFSLSSIDQFESGSTRDREVPVEPSGFKRYRLCCAAIAAGLAGFNWGTTEAEITAEMIDAGEDAILREVGGADLGGHFSASELAVSVFRAMVHAK